MSNRIQEEQLRIIREACDKKGIAFEKVGLPDKNIWGVEELINEADIVVTLGRGVLESIACKRIVVVYDYNGGDGMITPDNYYLLRCRNFSGRTYRIQFTVDSFIKELDKYNPSVTEELYDIVYNEHNLANIAEQYTDLYSKAIEYVRGNKSITTTYGRYLYLAIDEVVRFGN